MTKFLKYEDAKSLVRKLKIRCASEWRKYIVENKISGIPTAPDRYYKKTNEWENWMEWLGTKNKQHICRTHSVNENYFKTLSPNMFYILGLIYTDGHLNLKQNTWSISLHLRDIEVLNEIKKEIEFTGSFKGSSNNKILIVCSKEMVSDLVSFGLTNNKTFTCRMPKIPTEYIPHFIRGVWDGDGTIYLRKKESKYFSSLISASHGFIDDVLLCLKKIPQFTGYSEKRLNKTTKNTYSYILCNINNTRLLSHYFYDFDFPFIKMERKMKLFRKTGEYNLPNQYKKDFFLSYVDAKKCIQSLKLRSYRQWKKTRKEKKIENIPQNPDVFYKKEWSGWVDFLGTNVLSYKEAKEIVKKENLKNKMDWVLYAKTKRPKNIPSNPWTYYKEEWVNLQTWLKGN